MAGGFASRRSQYLDSVEAMRTALQAGNEPAFVLALSNFEERHGSAIVAQVREIADGLRLALEHFSADSRLARLASNDMPNARARLSHVIQLTDEAAHRTMDLIDECGGLVDQTAGDAAAGGPNALTAVAGHALALRARLNEMLVTQGFQDLSGQIIRSVMRLIDELESALTSLTRIVEPGAADQLAAATVAAVTGPVVPGVAHGVTVDGQQDVDALLSDMGI